MGVAGASRVDLAAELIFHLLEPHLQHLLLIRGFTSDCRAWYARDEALSHHYRLLIFDNRGAERMIQPGGHLFMVEEPDRFNDAVLDFLAQHEPTAAGARTARGEA